MSNHTITAGDLVRYRLGTSGVFIVVSFDGCLVSFVDGGEFVSIPIGDICRA